MNRRLPALPTALLVLALAPTGCEVMGDLESLLETQVSEPPAAAAAGPQPDTRPGPAPLAPPAPVETPSIETLAAQAGLQRDPSGSGLWVFRDEQAAFTARFRPDGSVRFDAAPPKAKPGGWARDGDQPPTGIPLPGPGDWAPRGDSDASAKRDLLERTRPFRIALATRTFEARARARLDGLEAELQTIWNGPKPAAARRAALFELWDDLDDRPAADADDPAAAALDEVRLTSVEKARDHIESFIRRVAPAGSPQAFTAAELKAFGARQQSARPFDPYGK